MFSDHIRGSFIGTWQQMGLQHCCWRPTRNTKRLTIWLGQAWPRPWPWADHSLAIPALAGATGSWARNRPNKDSPAAGL
jgi:hypothetical protein